MHGNRPPRNRDGLCETPVSQAELGRGVCGIYFAQKGLMRRDKMSYSSSIVLLREEIL